MIRRSNSASGMTAFVIYGIFLLVAVVVLFPLVWMFYTSFKSQFEIFQDPFGLPSSLNLDNYIHAWTTGDFSKYFFNSVVVTIPSVAATVAVSALAAYAFARIPFRWRNALYLFMLAGLIVPPQAIVIPAFLIVSHLGLISNFLALIFTYMSWCPIGILILTPFFASIPRDIEDAARVDGASRFAIFWRISLPLAQPALATVAIFYFVFIWNDFLYPLLYLQDQSMVTVPIGLVLFNSRYQVNWGLQTSALSIATIVPLVCYLMFQSRFVRGLTAGSMKG
jgi:ABC-type sugar transport system, permease component